MGIEGENHGSDSPGAFRDYRGPSCCRFVLAIQHCILCFMRPLVEQTILITGVTSGLGLALAQALASKGATVLLHGRDGKRGLAVLDEIKRRTGNDKLKFLSGGPGFTAADL